MALEWLVKYRALPSAERPLAERQAALDQLRRHAGAAKFGYPTGVDNDAIDRDLAREYEKPSGS